MMAVHSTVSTLGLSRQSVILDCEAGSGGEQHGNMGTAYTAYIDAEILPARQHHSQDILAGQQITWARDPQYTDCVECSVDLATPHYTR